MPESSIMNFKSTSESSRNSRIGFISGLGIELGGKGYLEKCTDLIELRLCDSMVTPGQKEALLSIYMFLVLAYLAS